MKTAIAVYHNKRRDSNGNTLWTLTIKDCLYDTEVLKIKTVKGLDSSLSYGYKHAKELLYANERAFNEQKIN